MNQEDFKTLRKVYADGGDISSIQWADDDMSVFYLHLSTGDALKVSVAA